MEYLYTYLSYICEKGNLELAESVKKTANEVGSRYLENFDFVSHEIGLLFGNIQSGKTAQMFGILSKATDLGFPVFLILTTDNVVLQMQTLNRVKRDLRGYLVCGENDSADFTDNNLVKPVIIVLKKNYHMLRLWKNIFLNTGFMKGNPLFIIDDEADAASLNTLVNKEKQSSINRYIDAIKTEASSSVYLQVTGTPQAILLQTIASGFKPMFTYYFEPGKGYLGGDDFFPVTGKSKMVESLNGFAEPEKNVLLWHLAASAQIFGAGGRVCNCLVHPSVLRSVHNEYSRKFMNVIDYYRLHSVAFERDLKATWSKQTPAKSEKLCFEKLAVIAERMLRECRILIMNQGYDVDEEDYSSGNNIIIGGNTLGRGVTFPALQTIYYSRTSKKPQADTMWQHSRMFGYDRDPGLMRLFIDDVLYKLFSDINHENNALIAQVEKGANDIHVVYPHGINPTRQNVLDAKRIKIIPGGTNYYPLDPDNPDMEYLDRSLRPYDNESVYTVNIRIIREILDKIECSSDFPKEAFLGFIDVALAKNPIMQGKLIVRRGRNITQGTGALLSASDWKLSKNYESQVVLIMYRVLGNGWKCNPIWVPNISLPSGVCYYDINEMKE